MKVEIVVSSKEIIKPSSPTPDFHGKHQLSFLDQISPCIFTPFVYFYPADGRTSNQERSSRLKKSLSRVLTRFYPVAGRMVDNLYIDCNDRGVEYFEAKAKAKLSEFLADPIDLQELNKFLPYELFDVKDRCMAVQVNFFDCGGIAIGLLISHKIADASSFFLFVNSWADVARGNTEIRRPKLDTATIFPPRDAISSTRLGVEDDGLVTKSFVFPNSKIAALRQKLQTNDLSQRPTRTEALITFIWSRVLASTEAKADPNCNYAISQVANLRTRLDPPLSEDYFGNMSRPAIAILSERDKEYSEKEGGYYYVVHKLREALSKLNGEYIAKLQAGDTRADLAVKGDYQKLIRFSFSSLWRFPSYKADFGWGKPVWIGMPGIPVKNTVRFMDTPSGNGTEVYITLKEEDMAKFEADADLCQFILASNSRILSKL